MTLRNCFMIEYELEFTREALEDIQRHKKSGNKPLLKKLEKLLGELRRLLLRVPGRLRSLNIIRKKLGRGE